MKRVYSFRNYDSLTMRAVAEFVRGFGGPCEVEVREPRRNVAQNAALHAALADVASQVVWHSQKLPAGVWKRLCTSAWLRENGGRPIMVPALDGVGVDVIFEKTSQLTVKECSDLLEWVHAFGAENGVKFSTNESPWGSE